MARAAPANLDGGKESLAIRYVSVGAILPAERNARTHSEQQVQQLADVIRQYGWTNPILVDEASVIIAGHGRLAAAKQLGMRRVPTIALAGLTRDQKRALALADNKLALNAGWDEELLRLELGELDGGAEIDIAGLGFSDDELAAIFAEPRAGLTDPDAVPDPPAEPVSVSGDVWLLGRHRLVCGDCTDPAAVAAVLGSVRPHLMVTDPPYGVDYDPGWRLARGVNKPWQTRAEGVVENDTRADWREAWALFPGAVAYVWCASLHSHEVAASLIGTGFELRSQLIWAKPSLVMGRGHYHWQHEPCWYAVRKGGRAQWSGDRKQATVWQIQNMHRTQGNVDDGKTNHSTQKPVECMRRPIDNNSSPGQAVYDPFSGSGTTIIAAEMSGRACHAIELSPAYVDVAVLRWQAFTGQAATLERTGRAFAAVAADRADPPAAPPARRRRVAAAA